MNRREMLKDTGLATAAVSLLAAGDARAQAPAAVNVLVAYHSVTGNTEKMAQGVADAAKEVSGANVVLKKVGDVTAEDLLAATWPQLHSSWDRRCTTQACLAR